MVNIDQETGRSFVATVMEAVEESSKKNDKTMSDGGWIGRGKVSSLLYTLARFRRKGMCFFWVEYRSLYLIHLSFLCLGA